MMLARLHKLLHPFVAICLFLNVFECSAQEYFKKYTSVDDFIGTSEIELLDNGNILFYHIKNSSIDGRDTLFLTTYNTCGNPVQSNKYVFDFDHLGGPNIFTQSLAVSPTGHPFLLLTGIKNGKRSLLLSKFSKDGSTIIWSKSYNYAAAFLYQLSLTQSSNIFIGLCPVSTIPGHYPEVVKLDSSGSVLNYFQLNKNHSTTYYRFCFSGENHFLFAVSNTLKRMDLNGNIQWEKSYSNINRIEDIEPTTNGHLILGSDPTADSAFNVFSIDKYGNTTQNESRIRNIERPQIHISGGKKLLVGHSSVYTSSAAYYVGHIYELNNGKINFGYYQTDLSVGYYWDIAYHDNSLHFLSSYFNPLDYNDISIIRGKVSLDTLNFFCNDGTSFDTSACPVISPSSLTTASDGITNLTFGVINASYSVFPGTLPVDSMCFLHRDYSNLFTIDTLTMCKGDYLDITRPEIYGTSFSWSTGDTSETIRVTEAGPYWVNMTFPCDDSIYADTVFVTLYPEPDTSIVFMPAEAEVDETVDFSNSSFQDSILWQFEDGYITNAFNFSRSFESSGWKPFFLTFYTPDGCTSTIQDSIWIKLQPVSVPNIFTPNGDGINDEMIIIGDGIESFQISIFNRWGNEVIQLQNQYWTGKSNTGELSADGVYFYVLTYSISSGEQFTRKGNVTLMSNPR